MSAPPVDRAEVERMAKRALEFGGAYSFGGDVHDTLLRLVDERDAAVSHADTPWNGVIRASIIQITEERDTLRAQLATARKSALMEAATAAPKSRIRIFDFIEGHQ